MKKRTDQEIAILNARRTSLWLDLHTTPRLLDPTINLINKEIEKIDKIIKKHEKEKRSYTHIPNCTTNGCNKPITFKASFSDYPDVYYPECSEHVFERIIKKEKLGIKISSLVECETIS